MLGTPLRFFYSASPCNVGKEVRKGKTCLGGCVTSRTIVRDSMNASNGVAARTEAQLQSGMPVEGSSSVPCARKLQPERSQGPKPRAKMDSVNLTHKPQQ